MASEAMKQGLMLPEKPFVPEDGEVAEGADSYSRDSYSPDGLELDAADDWSGDETLMLDESPLPVRTERRSRSRMRYRVEATLEFEGNGLELETRDLDTNGTGFLSPRDLSRVGTAVLHLPAPDGTTKRIECRIRRSRPIAEGWFEGNVEFAGPEPLFSEKPIEVSGGLDLG